MRERHHTVEAAAFFALFSTKVDTEMTDPAAGTSPSANDAATVPEQLAALLLKEEVPDDVASPHNPSTLPSSPKSLYSHKTGENTAPQSRRPLFSSVREALESSGQLKEEPGGYVIKRHSGHPQQFRTVERPKHRHAKQRSNSKGDTITGTAPNAVEDEADAAGYTVIRRRSSCDESVSALAASSTTTTGRRGQRASVPTRGNKKTQQQPQRPRRGSMSALPQSSSLLATMKPPSSPIVPPGFQPRSSSYALRSSPDITPAASGWVAKAAAPTKIANKIEEPPVEALWPEMKATSKTDNGWSIPTTTSMSESDLRMQGWPTTNSSTVADQTDDDDLLARLGVTL